jgi:magnesium-transporting ATPase (P-type)
MRHVSGTCQWTLPEAYWLSDQQVFEHLQSSPDGLSSEEVRQRLSQCGPNTLPSRAARGWWTVAWEQIQSPLVWVLLAAGGLAAVLGRPTDGLVIALVVIINTAIGIYQDKRANDALSALQTLVPRHCRVIRNGEKGQVDAAELVPGDIVLLGAGDQVPADLRMISGQGVRTVEAALTGESATVEKHPHKLMPQTPIADQHNMLFSGSLITSGSALAIVCSTGLYTQLGRISELLAEVEAPETPLTRKLHQMGRRLTLSICLVAGALFLIGVWRGVDLVTSTLSAISLAVAAIPEGLPALITMILAVGVHRMAQQQAVVKDLPAVEALGSTTIICTDKTGTLTQNLMAVREVWTFSGLLHVSANGYCPTPPLHLPPGSPGWERLAEACALCNDASIKQEGGNWSCHGDPTEGALMAFAARCGVPLEQTSSATRLRELPFDSAHRMMAVELDWNRRRLVIVKGAVDVIMERCQLNPQQHQQIHELAADMADRGLRVLAVAEADQTHFTSLSPEHLAGLTLLGLVAMEDPPRPEAKAAIATCRSAGIRVKMITGDHPVTARAIARALELSPHLHAMTGAELEALGPEEFDRVAKEIDIYARISPEQKLRLIEALQRDGQVVAMTGDGVNDGPALRRADVGVAMGLGGTAVAREAADLILLDDRFATIERAVEEGRRIFDNLVKSLAFLLPSNIGLALILFFGLQFMPVQDGVLQLPLEPLQVLWINLVAAVTLGLPLAFEPAEADVMTRPPRDPDAPLLPRILLFKGAFIALLVAGSSFGLFAWMTLLLQAPLERAQTVALHGVVLVQIAALLEARTRTGSLWGSLASNPWILRGISILLLLQALVTVVPFLQHLLQTSLILPGDLLLLGGLFVVALASLLVSRRWFLPQEK